MKNLDSITRARMKLSINVNGMYIPIQSVPLSIQRFCVPLAFHNDGEEYQLSFSGSCLLLRHHGRNLMLCSRHQLTNANRQPDEIVIVVKGEDGNRLCLNPNEVSQAVLQSASDTHLAELADILLAEYSITGPCGNISPYFLPLDLAATLDLRAVSPGDVDSIFAIGYPTESGTYDPQYNEDCTELVRLDITSRWVTIEFERADPVPWDQPRLVPLDAVRAGSEVPSDLDGMSGSPVFFIYGTKAGQPKLGFAGMILRADIKRRVNILEAAYIRQAVELHLGRSGLGHRSGS